MWNSYSPNSIYALIDTSGTEQINCFTGSRSPFVKTVRECSRLTRISSIQPPAPSLSNAIQRRGTKPDSNRWVTKTPASIWARFSLTISGAQATFKQFEVDQLPAGKEQQLVLRKRGADWRRFAHGALLDRLGHEARNGRCDCAR